MKMKKKNKSLLKKLDDYFFKVGTGMFWIPALLLSSILIMPGIINRTITETGIIVTIISIPVYWSLFCLGSYFYCGGTLKELFSK